MVASDGIKLFNNLLFVLSYLKNRHFIYSWFLFFSSFCLRAEAVLFRFCNSWFAYFSVILNFLNLQSLYLLYRLKCCQPISIKCISCVYQIWTPVTSAYNWMFALILAWINMTISDVFITFVMSSLERTEPKRPCTEYADISKTLTVL